MPNILAIRLGNFANFNKKCPKILNQFFDIFALKVAKDDVVRFHQATRLNLKPANADFLDEVGLNLALGLVTSYCGRQSA